MIRRLEHPFLTALSLNGPVLAVWYLLEIAQFGQLQHDRICDNIVFLVYFGIIWALLSILKKGGKPKDNTECSYVAVIRGTGGVPPRYVAADGSLSQDVDMAYPANTPEEAKDLAKNYPNAEIMAATLTVTMYPLR